MATETEKIKILQMIQNGKITAEQGIELLNACSTSEVKKTALNAAASGSRTPSAEWVRVIVTDMISGKRRVNVRMPAGLVNTGTKFGARLSIDRQNLDPAILRESIRSGKIGKILDVADDDEKERV
ncbi:MAG: SHOCT-like domain-containing protein, partial [Anaerolineaceae bacterium]